MSNLNCYNCDYRGKSMSSSHLSCKYPLFNEEQRIKISILSTGSSENFNQFLENNFGFKANIQGIINGWFSFPLDFDPTWINGDCNKHSSIVGEAVDYQIELNEYTSDLHKMFLNIQNGIYKEADCKFIIDAFEDSTKTELDLSKLSPEELTPHRNKMLVKLRSAHNLLVEFNKKRVGNNKS